LVARLTGVPSRYYGTTTLKPKLRNDFPPLCRRIPD
jgi:hypothetical protein